MKTVNIAELKKRLSTYVDFARNGEEVVIRDRNLRKLEGRKAIEALPADREEGL